MIIITKTEGLFLNLLRPFRGRFSLAAICCGLLAAAALPAARAGNAITWTSLTMASTATTGQSIPINITATNSGTTTWDGNYYIELSDQAGNHLYYPSLATTTPGNSKPVSFSWTMPTTPGMYTYYFKAVQNGVEYFSTQSRTVTIVSVNLSLDATTLISPGTTTARSTASPAGTVVYHGIEARLGTGAWQNWTVWNDTGGTQKTAIVGPSTPGTYEVRAYAAPSNGISNYSSSVFLTITAVAVGTTMSLDATTITVGQTTTARSTATPAGLVVYHGLEGRPSGGTWANWTVWNDTGGTQKTAAVGPTTPGTYEVRTYAAPSNGISNRSGSVFLTVNAAPPVVVNLALDSTSTVSGAPITAHSTATPAGQVVYHGVEARLTSSGTWQNWFIWNDTGGTQQNASVAASVPVGTYEVRAYAAPSNMVSNYSASTYVTVSAPVALTITQQPAAASPVLPGSASFTVAAAGNGAMTYQWQRRLRGTSTWNPVSNDGTFSGAQASQLTIGTTTTAMSQDDFRCVVTDATSAVGTSDPAKLVVQLDTSLIVLTAVNGPWLTDSHIKFRRSAAPAAQLATEGTDWHRQGDPMSVWNAMSASVTLGTDATDQIGETGPDWDYVRARASGPDMVSYYSALVPVTARPAKVRLAAKTPSGGWGTDAGTYDITLSSSQYVPSSIYRGFIQGSFSVGSTYTLEAWGYAPDGNCSQFEAKLYDLAAASDAQALLTATSIFGSSNTAGQAITFTPTHNGVYRLNVSYSGATVAVNPAAFVSYDVLVGPNPAPNVQSDFVISDKRGGSDNPTFAYRIGAAGALSDVLYYPTPSTMVPMTNGYGEKHTDGGFQWVAWSNETLGTQEREILYWDNKESPDFNMNQLGTHSFEANQFAPTISAVHSAEKVWEVYSAGQDQWFSDMTQYMNVKFPCYSRYELLDNGVVKVRTVILMGVMPISKGGTSSIRRNYQASFQLYHDFRAGTAGEKLANMAVDAYAYSPDFGFTGGVLGGYWVDDGHPEVTPDPSHTPILPGYGHELAEGAKFAGPQAQNTKGYVLAFNSHSSTNAAISYGPAMATVFGKQGVLDENGNLVAGSALAPQLRWTGGDALGFTVIPELKIPDPGVGFDTVGKVLDYTFYLAGDTAVTPAYLAMLDNLVTNGDGAGGHPGVTVYGPTFDFSSNTNLADLAAVVTKLKEIRDKNNDIWGARTDRLGGLNR